MLNLKLIKRTLGVAAGASLISFVAMANSSDNYSISGLGQPTGSATVQNNTQDKISEIFSNLETVGSSYNAGGGSAAAMALMDAGCRAALNRAIQTKLYNDVTTDLTPDYAKTNRIGNYLAGRLSGMGKSGMNQLCAALKGEQVSAPDMDAIRDSIRNDLSQSMVLMGQGYANASGLPFLTNLEIEVGTSYQDLIGSITSVQPLWQDPNDLHHVFTQLSYHRAPDELNNQGVRDRLDTYNAGFAYRYLTPDKNYIYGANVFFDYAPRGDHTRVSFGVDARTSQLAFSANRYLPLSDFRGVDLYNERGAAAGFDMELRGQVPQLPSWTAIAKAYQWDSFKEGEQVYGGQAALEYSPFPAMALRMGVRDESQSDATFEAALRFNYRFDQPQDLQFKQRTELAPVADYVYDKVHRDNVIRLTQRRREESKLWVKENVGATNYTDSVGSGSASIGQNLMMPTTITTANTGGAYSRLIFSDGSALTLAQNTSVTVVPNLITLNSGSIQYVNNGAVQTVNVPGGTITLHGTDIDVVALGGSSSTVRVRDGNVDFVGSTSGSTNLTPEQLAQSNNGVVGGILAPNNSLYISHTDTISSQIDRVASELDGQKVTPYPFEAPRVVSHNMVSGGKLVLALKFNDAVAVSGGTPRLNVTIKGISRVIPLSSGSGTDDLVFTYDVLAADANATAVVVNSFDKNGASITGNGKDAVTTIADVTLPLTSSTLDTTNPSGYTVAFTTDPVNLSNYTAGAFQFSAAEVGANFNYSITSSGGGTAVTGSGSITSATQTVSGVNLTSLNDGTLTVSVTLIDPASNVGAPSTDTVVKDIVAPTVTSITVTNGTYEP